MLMDEKHIHNGDHNDSFSNRACQASDEVNSNQLASCVEVRPPEGRGQLYSCADEVQGTAPVLVHTRNQKEASNCKSGNVGAHGFVEGRIR